MIIKPLTNRALILSAELVQWLNKRSLATPKSKSQKRHHVNPQVITISQGVGAGLKFAPDNSNPDFAKGTYEVPLQKALADYLKPGDVFYDIGANIGFFTVLGAHLVGKSGYVYGFEPVPENVQRIRHNLQLNNFSHTTVLENAVSVHTGGGRLLLAQHSGGAMLASAGTPPDFTGAMNVNLACIDDLVAQKALKPPTLVKVDVEGAEIDAFKGMRQTIEKYKPTIIYEVDDGNKESFAQKSKALENLISSMGYQVMPLAAGYPGVNWHIGHFVAIPCEQSSQLLSNKEELVNGSRSFTPPNRDNIILSVIIPCFNDGKFLLEAIASVEACKENFYEIIIVNDGSTDPLTLEVINSLKQKGYFVIVQQNQGQAKARNTGIQAAKGQYILTLDSDDKIRGEVIIKAVEVLEKKPEVGVVFGDLKFFNDYGKVFTFGIPQGYGCAEYINEQEWIWRLPDFHLYRMVIMCYLSACAVFRKSAWQECGGYDTKMPIMYGEDWELWLNIAKKGWKFHHIPEVLLDCRFDYDPTVKYTREKQQLAREYIREKHRDLFLKAEEWMKSINEEKKVFAQSNKGENSYT
ncbi:MAG: FkbM family methyltransferase [Calothrix sp. MO_192.B10]|nr:FkbM family methyltransferase [Calothrix sp. MO_192.B10]